MKILRRVFFGIFIFTLSLFILSFYPPAATLINNSICRAVRELLYRLSGTLGFSLFEFLVILSPLIVIFAIVRIRDGSGFVTFLSCLSLVASLYLLTLGIAYNAPTDLTSDADVTDAEIIAAARTLCDRVNSYADAPPRTDAVPYAKPIAASGFLSGMRILGFYSFLTSEININTKLPEYMCSFTAFHEYAHKEGYAREGEADLYAYLAMQRLGEYEKYCSDLIALECLLSDVYEISQQEYVTIRDSLSDRARTDMRSYSDLLRAYDEISASDKLSDAHLSVWDGAAYSDFSRLVTVTLKRGTP